MKRNAIRLAQEVLRSRRKRADGGTDDWQSTGKLVRDDSSINWGDPEIASDFFRADKEDLRRRQEAEREDKLDRSDVTGSIAPARTSEGRQMAEARPAPPKAEEPAAEAPEPAAAPPAPPEQRQPSPVMAGATPPLSSELDRGPMPPAMQAVANRYSPRDYQEALTDEQRQALALQQWKEAGRSGTPDNPNPAPPAAAAPAPIVQASLTTPHQTANDANRQPLRFGPAPGTEPPAAPTSAILAAIRFNESRNKPTAQNPRSSAGGLYQFLDSTWGSTLRRMDPQQFGRYNDRQLRSLKTDPRYTDLQHSAADFLLTKDIAPRLEKAGIPLTPGSAYLSWFQGPAGAVKTYTAPDNATVAQVFPRTVAANSNMRFNGKSYANWTMSDLRQWADTKMAQRMQPARQPLRFGPAEGYEEGGRVGYANEGAVDDQPVDVGYTDPMGNVAYSDNKDNREAPGYKTVEAASDLAGKLGASVGEPMRKAAENYIGNVGKAWHESGEYARQGLENTTSDKGPLYNVSGPLQYGLGSIGQIFSPLTGAAMSAGDAATQLSGNPEIGKRVELIGGFVDPSHAGALKNFARAAHEVAPAMAIPAAKIGMPAATEKSAISEIGNIDRRDFLKNISSMAATAAADSSVPKSLSNLIQNKQVPESFRPIIDFMFEPTVPHADVVSNMEKFIDAQNKKLIEKGAISSEDLHYLNNDKKEIIDALNDASKNNENHKWSSADLANLRGALEEKYNVDYGYHHDDVLSEFEKLIRNSINEGIKQKTGKNLSKKDFDEIFGAEPTGNYYESILEAQRNDSPGAEPFQLAIDKAKETLDSSSNKIKNEEYIPHNDPERGKNFEQWFGDSLVKNQDGTPKTVYHGSGSDFSVFRPSATGEFGPGIYATDLADEASAYAGTHPEGTGQNVMPVHIRMEQPFVAKDPSEFWEKFGGKTDEEAMQNAKKAGYDGVIIERPYTIYDEKRGQFYPTGQNHTHYVVFDPGQIKSATGNSGKFSLKDTDITKNEGGAVDRAMNISRFGTDAVQSAVNLARQHRGRPETPRSTS